MWQFQGGASLSSPEHFLNREIGWLKFNKRVLYQAKDLRTPLLERVRFLNIFHSNLDEFFMKRVGGLKRQYLAQVASISHDGLTPEEQLKQIRDKVLSLNHDIDSLLEEQLLPELKEAGIELLQWSELSKTEQDWASDYFTQKIFPVLTPMAVDLGHPFPHISNLSTSLAVCLKVPHEVELLFARIKVPDYFPAWIRISTSTERLRFLSVLEIIKYHIQDLFPGMEIKNIMSFRVTRNVDIESDTEDAEDLLEVIEEEVRLRRFASVVRLEHGPDPDPWLLQFLTEELELSPEDIYSHPVSLEFKNLTAIANLNMPHLKYKTWTPVTPPQLLDEENSIFNVIRSMDLLVHHPYESFSSVERFIHTASIDPEVVAIKMTLYRTSEESPIVSSLIRAAESGKQVVCLIELQARFDEERNISWAQAMEQAGVHVVYGIVGLKTHAKICLVVRREKDAFLSYVHIGTGNYHSQTARLYTDMGLLTCRPEIAHEVVEIFHYLTGRSLKSDYKKLLVSPINLKQSFLNKIHQEKQNALDGKPAQIIAKCNSLEDKDIIEALYEASQAGVSIDLIVRGFSCLRPQTPGLSKNIRLISIVGQFLEHSRIFFFQNAQSDPLQGLFYIGSADWMARNLLGRVEVVTPIDDFSAKEKIWAALQIMLQDQRSAWDMDSEGHYHLRSSADADDNQSSQSILMKIANSQH